MADNNKIEIRSKEVQEIMGTPPKWIVRWGITIIFMVVLVLFAGSYFYKYPDVVTVRLVIVSENPPVSIIAHSDGKLDKIFVQDKQQVAANTKLGVIENQAKYEDVYELVEELESIHPYFNKPAMLAGFSFNREYILGLSQEYFSSFAGKLREYQIFIKYNTFEQRIKSLEKQVADYASLSEQIRQQINVLNQDYILASSQFYRDSALYVQNLISDIDFEKSEALMLKQKSACQNALVNLGGTQITMNNLKQQIQEQTVLKAETENLLMASLKEKYDNLVNQLKAWEQACVLKTPITGKVAFTNFTSLNQLVLAGNVVFKVVPEKVENIKGKASIPAADAGKVEVGQRVNIKLDNFPYMEYGLVEGKITNISMLPVTHEKGIYYIVEIGLINNLVTNYKKELPFNYEMQGNAEIITKDRRLIERLVEPLVSVFRERF